MSPQPASTSREIVWPSVITVISAAILIGAEVFGAAFAGGWALAILFGLERHQRAHPAGGAVCDRRDDHGRLHPRRAAHRAVYQTRLTRVGATRASRRMRETAAAQAPNQLRISRNLNVRSPLSSAPRAENEFVITRSRNLSPAQKNCCEAKSKVLFPALPNFARACGRVSVGRYPDKRPDSRQGMEEPRVAQVRRPASLSRDAVEGLSIFCNRDWQPEANRRTPLSTGDAT